MVPKQVEFPQESNAERWKGIGQREGLSFGKRFQTVLTTSKAILQDEIKVVIGGRNHTTQ